MTLICVLFIVCIGSATLADPVRRPGQSDPSCYFRNGKALCGAEGVKAREADRRRVNRARQRGSPDFFIPGIQSDDPFIRRQAAANDKGNIPPQEFVAPPPATVRPPPTTTTRRPCPLVTTTRRPCPMATTTTQNPCKTTTTPPPPCPYARTTTTTTTTTPSPCDVWRAKQNARNQYQADEPINPPQLVVDSFGLNINVAARSNTVFQSANTQPVKPTDAPRRFSYNQPQAAGSRTLPSGTSVKRIASQYGSRMAMTTKKAEKDKPNGILWLYQLFQRN